jgi:hypothetical protein
MTCRILCRSLAAWDDFASVRRERDVVEGDKVLIFNLYQLCDDHEPYS